MPVRHLPSTATVEAVSEVLAADGCVVIDELVDPAVMDQVNVELEPFMAETPYGDDFSGHRTRRTGGLVARSPASRDLVMHPTVTGAVGSVLGHATTFQLHLTQVISIEPGQDAQYVHRDQWAFDFFSFPNGYEVTCNTIWAMSDFTEENGGTRVIPGSHRFEDKLRFTEADTEAAEMKKGSALIYTGALYHGGGPEPVRRTAQRREHHVLRRLAAPGGEPVPLGPAGDRARAARRPAADDRVRARRVRARLRRRPPRPDRGAARRRPAVELRLGRDHAPPV